MNQYMYIEKHDLMLIFMSSASDYDKQAAANEFAAKTGIKTVVVQDGNAIFISESRN